MGSKKICTLNTCIQKLQKNKIKGYNEIPEEYYRNQEIINLARDLGLRKLAKRGYDILSKSFFVEEIITEISEENERYDIKNVSWFDDFQSYFNFLQGDIYNNACYFQYNFSSEMIQKFQIDKRKLNKKCQLNDTINSLSPEPSSEEKEKFVKNEEQKTLRKKWISMFNASSNAQNLKDLCKKHKRSHDKTELSFYLWNYINHHKKDSFDGIVQLIATDPLLTFHFEKALLFLYESERVLKTYKCTALAPSTNQKHNTLLKRLAEDIKAIGVQSKILKYFDTSTNYYCVETKIYLTCHWNKYPETSLYQYFETFAEFATYLDNDLSDCDLSKAQNLSINLSLYKTNEFTKLPISSYLDLKRVISKKYNRINSKFEVVVKWYTSENIVVYEKVIQFDYFYEFVAFLNNDLSDADLLFCNGLINLSNVSKFNLSNVLVKSDVSKKLNLPCERCETLKSNNDSFSIDDFNKSQSVVAIAPDRKDLSAQNAIDHEQTIYYVTDLHLLHKVDHAKCITHGDCIYVIQQIIDGLIKEIPKKSLVLIGGDIASEFWVYKLFINLLRQTIDELCLYINVVITLGNHDLWSFSGTPLNAIIKEYRDLLSSNKMYLLQNEILYLDKDNQVGCISEQQLSKYSSEELKEILRAARIALFGGIGFSKYNEKFNATAGIYRSTISREEEINEGEKIEKFYERVVPILLEKNTIILTHTPFTDWYANGLRQRNFVYVSGHNHKNDFYDDGEIRIYADNQVGYHTEHPKLKCFYLDDTYDWFSKYTDGIYLISREDYINFYRGKKIPITFNKSINKLYMLKKNSYYCFIHENQSGGLTILNGGSPKSLMIKAIQWYYDNMDNVIDFIKKPLNQYQSIQLEISKALKRIGGSGEIHGAIVDIDCLNHIFVNPHDLTITPYFAWDIIEKYTYPSIPTLLKSRCPELYQNYTLLLAGESLNALAPLENPHELYAKPQLYSSTDIYTVSREIRKIQKLNDNILSKWYDNIPGINALSSKNDKKTDLLSSNLD